MKLKLFSISLILFVLTFPSVCFSQKPDPKVWEYYGKDSTGGVYYCSRVNVNKSSDIIPFRIYYSVSDKEREERVEKIKKYDLKKSVEYQTYDHDISVVEIDCRNKLTWMAEYAEYDRQGNALKYDINDDREWKKIPPDSVIEAFYKKQCAAGKKPSGEK
jgi:hypothetical protein